MLKRTIRFVLATALLVPCQAQLFAVSALADGNCLAVESALGFDLFLGCNDSLSQGGGSGGTPVAYSPPVCRDATGSVIPCRSAEFGEWNGRCYLQRLSPEPPPTDPIWAGRTSGGFLTCTTPDGTSTVEYVPTVLIDLPNAEDIARSAVASMNLPAAAINLTPQPNLIEPNILIHRDNHLWVPAGTLTPRTTSASDAGLTVTLAATPTNVTFTSPDGDSTTSITCDPASISGPPADPHATPAACAMVWLHPSGDTPTGQYTITATVTWTITWQGPGQSGTLTTTPTSTIQVAVTDHPVRLVTNPG